MTPARGERVAVTRSGGFAGLHQSGELLLGEDPRTGEVERLLGAVDLSRVTASRPPHVNIDEMVIRPRAQAAQHKVHRVP